VTPPGIFSAATGLFAAQGCSYTDRAWPEGHHCDLPPYRSRHTLYIFVYIVV